jgi:hypothetical protein
MDTALSRLTSLAPGRPPAPLPAASPEPTDAALLRDLVAEVRTLREEVRRLQPPAGRAQTPAEERPHLQAPAGEPLAEEPRRLPSRLEGFSPFGAAFGLPAYAAATAYHGLNLAAVLGSGQLVYGAALHGGGVLNSTQQAAVRLASGVSRNEALVRALPVLGGVAAGILLVKGLHEISLDTSARGQILGLLDCAAAVGCGLATIPGLESASALGTLGALAARALAGALAPEPGPLGSGPAR